MQFTVLIILLKVINLTIILIISLKFIDNNYNGSINIGSLLSGMCDCLSTSDNIACNTSMKDSVGALAKLIYRQPEGKFINNIFLLIRSMKIIPILTELLSLDNDHKSLSTTLRRLCFPSNKFSTNIDSVSYGIFNDLKRHSKCCKIEHQIIIEKSTRFILSIDEIDKNSFEQCLRFTNCILYLISNIVRMGSEFNTLISDSDYEIGFDIFIISFTSQIDLFSLILTKEYREKYLDIHLQSNDLLPLQIMKSALIFLQTIYDEKIYFTKYSLQLINSICNLFCAMIDISYWRANLGLGGPYRNCPINNMTMYFFELIISFRLLFYQNMNSKSSKYLENDITVINDKLDLLILLFLQFSYQTRSFFMNFSIQENNRNTNSPEVEVFSGQFDNLFRYYLSIISEAENILSTANLVVTTTKKDTDRW